MLNHRQAGHDLWLHHRTQPSVFSAFQLPFMPGFLFSFVHLSSLVWNATGQTLSDCQWRERTLHLSLSVNSIFLVCWRHFHPVLAKCLVTFFQATSAGISTWVGRGFLRPLSSPASCPPSPRDCTCKCSPMC